MSSSLGGTASQSPREALQALAERAFEKTLEARDLSERAVSADAKQLLLRSVLTPDAVEAFKNGELSAGTVNDYVTGVLLAAIDRRQDELSTFTGGAPPIDRQSIALSREGFCRTFYIPIVCPKPKH